MKRFAWAALPLLALGACDKKEASPAAPPLSASPRPEKIANGEPAVVTVKHVLISFIGTPETKATRTREEAEKLAFQVLDRARSGEDFDKLMKDLSDDAPEGGIYSIVNQGVERRGEEYYRSGRERSLVKSFGDVGFRLEIGQIGIADYDPETSPFGYHIIKRVK